jgi:hypothetical protein
MAAGAAHGSSPAASPPLTLQFISSKEGSKAVFQRDNRPPEPAGGAGHHKPGDIKGVPDAAGPGQE